MDMAEYGSIFRRGTSKVHRYPPKDATAQSCRTCESVGHLRIKPLEFMKSKHTSLIGLFTVITLTPVSYAADATWNVNADGNWADAANWDPAAAPGATTGTTNADSATFGTIISAITAITVDADRNLAGIDFAGNSSAYTLGGGSLILTSGGTLKTSGGGSGHTDTVSSPITLANADSDTKGSYSILSDSTTATRLLVVSGNITGSATSGTTTLTLGGANTGNNTISGVISDGGGSLAVEKTGAGSWILNNTNTFSGGLNVREGLLRLAAGTGGVGGTPSVGTGTITLGDTTGTSTATIVVSNSFNVNRPLTVASGSSGVKTLSCGNVSGPGYNGAITLNDNLTVATTSNAAATNFSFAGSGNINLNANTLNLSLVPTGSGNATVTISKPMVGTGGTVVIAGAGTSTGTRTVALSGANTYTGGTTVGGTGTNRSLVVNVSNDQSAATGGWKIDINNETTSVTSTVNFATGSIVAVASGQTITLGGTTGHFGGRTLNADGTVTNDGSLIVRRSSTVNVTGEWTQNGTATIAPQGGGNAALNVNAGGALTYASGTNFLINSSGSTGMQSNVTINGGLMTTGVAFRNNSGTAPTGTASNVVLNNGGTLRLSGNVAQLLTNNVGIIRMQLGETGTGGVIDTNGFSTEIDKEVGNVTGQAGKLTKQGLGTLTLSGTPSYTGSTTVSAGTLSVVAANFADDSTVSIAAGATLNLNFTGTDTIGTLILGETTYTTGTFNSSSLPGSAFLTGDGILQVGSSDPYTAWIDSFFSGETNPEIIGKSADPDNDSMPNAIEFLTGGNPASLTDKGLLWIGTAGDKLVLSLAIRGEATVFTGTPSPAATVDGVIATVQGSAALSTFDSPVSGIPFVLPAAWSATPPTGFSYHSFQLDASTGLPDKGFLRLSAQ
jgi:autotransporter-associated beta strand protein